MEETGWIKAYRKIEDDPVVCKDNDYFRVWFYLLFNATHKEQKVMFKNKEIVIPKGSLVTGRKKISDKCNISESKVDRILKSFEKYQKIEQQMSNKNRLITIKKWYLYQKREQQMNNNCTTSEHKQECKNNKNEINSVFNNSKIENICHFKLEEKCEGCVDCMKKKICKNPTSSEFLLRHNGQAFEKYDAQRTKKLNQIASMKTQEDLDLEILDYDFLEDSESIVKE